MGPLKMANTPKNTMMKSDIYRRAGKGIAPHMVVQT